VANTDDPEFDAGWARITALAFVDPAFRAKLESQPVEAFAEFGFSGTAKDLSAFVSKNLEPSLASLHEQQAQQRAAQDQAAGVNDPVAMKQNSNYSGGSPTMTNGMSTSGSSCSTLPCWGVGRLSHSLGFANVDYCSASTGTQATGCGTGSDCIATAGSYAYRVEQPMSTRLSPPPTRGISNADCLGTAGTLGTWCGTGATAGTYGCAVEQPMSTRLSPPPTRGISNADCLGTAGTLGTWCGTGATAGTYGCAVEQPMSTRLSPNARLTNAGTLGSFATLNDPGQFTGCWGTVFG
jgi:hypothetical protein